MLFDLSSCDIRFCGVDMSDEEWTMASGVAATRLKELHFINWLN